MRRFYTAALLLILACGVACSAGGGGGNDDPSTTIVANFEPETTSPGANSVVMGEGGAQANLVIVAIRVTGVTNLYGAAFDVTFDSAQVNFESTQAGTILESGGNSPIVLTSQPQAGHLVVSISRRNGTGVGGIDVPNTQTLISLRMRVTEVGTSPVSFLNATLYDSSPTPQEMLGTTWSGGSLVGR